MAKQRRKGQDHVTPGAYRYMGFDPTQNVSNITQEFNEVQTQRTINDLNHRATTDPTMTVGEYQRQMEAATGVKSTVKPNYQIQIDDLNRRAASDPNMTFGEYQAQMSSLVNEGEGSVDIDRATQRQLDTINQQSAIDELNQRAASDPSLTFGEYQEQMQNIVGEVQDINYRDQLNAIDEQAAIDELNKRATSDPNLTVDEYKRLMEDITGENKIAWDSAYQQQMDELNRRATSDPNMTMGEYGTRMAELAEQEAVDDINRRAADPSSGMTVEEYMKEMSSVTGEEINLRDVGSTLRNQNAIDPRNRRNVITKDFKGSIGEGKNYSGEITNGYMENVKFFDDNGEEFGFEFKHQKDGSYHLYNSEGDLITDDETKGMIEYLRRGEVESYYHSLNDKQWETIIENPEQFRFSTETNGEYSGRLLNQNEAIKRRQYFLNKDEQVYEEQLKEAKKKKDKETIKNARNAAGIKNLEMQRLRERNEFRVNSMNVKKGYAAEFNKTLGLDQFERGSKEYYDALKAVKESNPNLYNSAVEKMKENVKVIDSDTRKGLAAMNERIDGQIKGLQVEPMGVQQAINLAFTAKTAVDKYKQSRAEGKGVVSSVARSAGSAVIAETVGLTGTLAITAATALPKLAVSGASTLYSEHRRMNSASNFRPLGGVNYQDSQELATMRQSGMELAKMAQYNLEQTLMGAEAKHLHR